MCECFHAARIIHMRPCVALFFGRQCGGTDCVNISNGGVNIGLLTCVGLGVGRVVGRLVVTRVGDDEGTRVSVREGAWWSKGGHIHIDNITMYSTLTPRPLTQTAKSMECSMQTCLSPASVSGWDVVLGHVSLMTRARAWAVAWAAVMVTEF